MPHSISPEDTSTPDEIMSVQDADVDGETQMTEGTLIAESEERNGDTQASDVTDQDMTMADIGNDEEKLPKKELIKDEFKSEVKLEDLFADIESDDEFPSSAVPDVKISSSPEAPESPVHIGPTSRASDPEVMRSFYQRLFPWRYLFQWLNHSPTPSTDFGHREFAFTLQNDAYLRYQSFPTSDLLRKDVLRLNPSRFEIGPVYSTNPRDRKTLRKASSFKPIAKELCFDIDLTDYDDIRTCCDKANICNKCWQFMTMAIKVIDVALREDFGFKHIMWVYSGRRGAHAWVCDKKARTMDDQKRRAIAGYLEVIKGGAQSGKRVNVKRPLHSHVARSLDILKPHFESDVLQDQDPWETDEKFARLLELLPDRTLNEALKKKWSSAPGRSSTSKWADIHALAKSGVSKALDTKALRDAQQDIILEYTYPRLDIEVSKHLNHLLKSPFVVHPGTGRVCVPIDTKRCEDFDPLTTPTVTDLLREIDEWKAPEDSETEDKKLQDWEKTSLKPYVEYFRSFVLALMKDEKDIKVKREREENGGMDF
ncbi:prim-pol domain-containing protein [Mollisia scopiformis]|uniref:DNA primase n=1 Tax=Mollisia scopiformis TaxID=149040 RepID=A0A194WRQ4_MOLSC|nr:prim-pol domain-containing protein [Mollisia scopiformis]KUJ10681.1 prim-pol domain-containing protein [Mollisia scopiformis]